MTLEISKLITRFSKKPESFSTRKEFLSGEPLILIWLNIGYKTPHFALRWLKIQYFFSKKNNKKSSIVETSYHLITMFIFFIASILLIIIFKYRTCGCEIKKEKNWKQNMEVSSIIHPVAEIVENKTASY